MLLDRINFGQKPVADWFYDFEELDIALDYVPSVIGTENKKILSLLNTTLQVFEKHQLFLINKIEVIGFFESDKDKSNRIEKIIETKNLGSFKNIQELIESQLNLYFKESFVLYSIYFHGETSILNENNKKGTYNNIFYFLLQIPGIQILTDCDVWLPYNLKGESQKEIYKLNAPRLENALTEIEEITGFEPVWENTKYAIVNKYKLENYSDEDEILNVYDD